MKENTFQIKMTQYDHRKELPFADQELVNLAFEAAQNAYSPYSGFAVGAALRLANGVVVTGNNQENAAYPSGLCAERVAMFCAASQYRGIAIESIAIVAQNENFDIHEPFTPCGACRQVMVEYEQLHQVNLRVILATKSGKCVVVEGMENLLPLAFLAKYLKE
ncbi:MAG: cytidine deaminase [Bacteroidales bacterium]|jgi:cytidine deaminase|nr:cytidine deaminase [Bacteroidales bacterium]